MQRRDFLRGAAVTGTAAPLASLSSTRHDREPGVGQRGGGGGEPFTLKFAPHFGMFRHHAGNDLVDQIHFMADQGFRALEDNGMKGRKVEVQENIRKALDEHDMEMGVFVAFADFRTTSFASGKKDDTDRVLKEIEKSVEVAKRVRAKWCTVVPGRYDLRLDWDYQTANVIDNLKRCAEICEKSGLVMVLEPLNERANHPGQFLTKIPQAYMICRSVGSPSCKILNDLYHQQITEGNLIPNVDKAWSEIAYFQIGDNPGRKEPTTGEIHYANVFRHVHEKGFDGIWGMEHGNSKKGKEGELAVIAAYRACDVG